MNSATRRIKSRVKNKDLIEVRRNEIVKAAVELFVKKGFHKTTVREISTEFGMSMGTLYDYIRTKEDILYLVCDYIHNSTSNKLRSSLTENSDSLKNLKDAINDYFVIIDELQDYLLLLYQETKSLDKKARKYIYNAEKELTQLIENILLKCIHDKTINISRQKANLVAHNIMVAGHMWAFRRWVLQKEYLLNDYIKIQTDLILKGIVNS